jgi:Trypsin-like peptidase domain/MAP3K TRAFs-binding domain
MGDGQSADEFRQRARDSCRRLRGIHDDDELLEAKALVAKLRDRREYDLMGQLAEAVSRVDPKDVRNRRLYAQYLIETGKATAAVDLLKPLGRRLDRAHPEFAETTGLLGRAYKQIFCDAGDKTSATARDALKQALAMYRAPLELDAGGNSWHGVNLLALLIRARRLGIKAAPDLQPTEVARTLVEALGRMPAGQRGEWFLPTLAEASLGLGDWSGVEQAIRAYAGQEGAGAFLVASTLRQFTEVWDLESIDDRGRALVSILRARLAELPGGGVQMEPRDLQRAQQGPGPDSGQLEAILGLRGPESYRWWKTGMERALSVAAVYQRNGDRIGTGFLVRADDFGRRPGDELLVLTNFHVVNPQGLTPGIQPEQAEIAFEAVDPERRYLVGGIAWTSSPDRHDASLLRLKEPVGGIQPMPLARTLPAIEPEARIYIIGHPRGGALSFSFQDNELLDHEGPPAGSPQIQGVCRVHYRTPTVVGSSGSPAFDAKLWEVVALHHKGGSMGVPKLNGRQGSYAANEGLALDAMRAEAARA